MKTGVRFRLICRDPAKTVSTDLAENNMYYGYYYVGWGAHCIHGTKGQPCTNKEAIEEAEKNDQKND